MTLPFRLSLEYLRRIYGVQILARVAAKLQATFIVSRRTCIYVCVFLSGKFYAKYLGN